MATVPTYDDLFQAGRREVVARPSRLTPEIVDTRGSDVNIAIASVAAMAEETAAYSQGEINSARLGTALSVSTDALEQWGASELASEPPRRGAISAIVPVEFLRQTGAGITVAAGTIVATQGGVTFRTVSDLLFANGETGPKTVFALATTAGPGGNVPANTISLILGQIPDPTLTVANAEPASGGRPPETPEEYQGRLQTAYQRARKATLRAIQEDAAAVDGVVSARAYEILDGDCPTGRVVVQVLGAGGTSNSALAARVRDALNNTRAAGVPVIVVVLSPVIVQIQAYGLLIAEGFDPGTVLTQASRAVVAYVETVQVGSPLYVSKLLGVLATIDGLSVPAGALVSPATDVQPAANAYVITTLDDVLLTQDAAP